MLEEWLFLKHPVLLQPMWITQQFVRDSVQNLIEHCWEDSWAGIVELGDSDGWWLSQIKLWVYLKFMLFFLEESGRDELEPF